ncbi:MAG: response regulator [Armatimonadota bacterium]|nr:response regulator [Armatimonadota bacterium]
MPTETPLAPFIGTRSARILIVDDEPVNLKVLSAHLTRWGCTVHAAASGADALAVVPVFQPDLILLDILMPGMSGLDVCAKLQEDPSTQHIPVVFLTALAREEAKVKGLDAGARDYITKPFMVPELAARVGAALREKFSEDVLRARHDELVREISRDPLTGLVNRAGFDEAAARLLAGDAGAAWPLSLLLVDLDDFARYNATVGHRRGDEALRLLADVIRAYTRRDDLAARVENDTFACLLPAAAQAVAAGLAEQVRRRCEGPELTASVGGATLISSDGQDAAAVLARLHEAAGAALARAKAAGGNRVVWA